jgi:benzil reductase ((S)-benzoin forming)
MSAIEHFILTGASRGLGLAMARQLRQRGVRLLTLSRRPEPGLDGPGVEQWAVDLAQPAEAALRLQAWVAALPRAQVASLTLINNAAGLSTPGPLAASDASELRAALRVGLEKRRGPSVPRWCRWRRA